MSAQRVAELVACRVQSNVVGGSGSVLNFLLGPSQQQSTTGANAV